MTVMNDLNVSILRLNRFIACALPGQVASSTIAADIKFVEHFPAYWQVEMGCRSRGNKSLIRDRAAELFPGLHVTQETGDAVVIAEFCRRLRTSEAGST